LTASVESDAQPATAPRRFAGLERLYGIEGAALIRAAHIAVIGIGGVGSWSAEALARSGVGQLTLVDMDHVSESNVNRQIHALTGTLGQSKIVAMRDRIIQINPECQVTLVDDFVVADNWPQILPSPVDAVLDACDQITAKTAIAAWALGNKLPLITVGAAGGKRQAHRVEIDDLSQSTHDPLLAQLRYRLRKSHGGAREGKKIGVACVFSREEVRMPNASFVSEKANQDAGNVADIEISKGDGTLNCHGYGSVVSVTATFGLCAAGWLLDKISSGP
jgi:tRNA threonylcarbamoyladenosine dehydratase